MTGADWAKLAAGIGAAGIGAYVANRNGRRQQESDEARLQMTEEQHLRQTALDESMADPFRHQRAQASGLGAMDVLRNFQGTRVTPPANVAPYAGNIQGGYAPSQTLRDHASKLYDSIAAGRTAPTMTDPANYGRTSAENLTAGTGAAGLPGATAPAEEFIDPTSYLAGFERRNEGAGGVWDGVKKGTAVGATAAKFAGPYAALALGGGAVIGGIAGAFTKNAKTAMTDVTVDQAKQALRAVYEREGGRTPTEQELDQIIAGQGYKPGDWGVGEGGLINAIRNLQTNFSKERRGRAA